MFYLLRDTEVITETLYEMLSSLHRMWAYADSHPGVRPMSILRMKRVEHCWKTFTKRCLTRGFITTQDAADLSMFCMHDTRIVIEDMLECGMIKNSGAVTATNHIKYTLPLGWRDAVDDRCLLTGGG